MSPEKNANTRTLADIVKYNHKEENKEIIETPLTQKAINLKPKKD